MTIPIKPLGGKAYGHIPHLPGSRLGPGDHKVPEGQGRICTHKTRDRHDQIFVQEKLDGSCVVVARIDGVIQPLIRAGYPAESSHHQQHRLFARWVWENHDRFLTVLRDDERLCGEWLALAHGTRYQLPHEPFVAFDLMRGLERTPLDELLKRVAPGDFVTPRIIHRGGPISVDRVQLLLEPSGHGALDPVEGAVWRVERRGAVDFVAKWVRTDKIDGCYLPDISGKEPIWNWIPGA